MDETHHGRFVGKLEDVVRVVEWSRQECQQQWTKHTALRCPCAQCGGAGGVIPDPDCLGSPCQKVQDPGTERCVQA